MKWSALRISVGWNAVPTVAAAVLLAFGVAATVIAQTAQKPVQPTGKEDVKVLVAGQQVSIDPKTGKMRQPTPEEARALAEALKQQLGRSTPLQVIQSANGMLSVELPEDYMETAVVRRNLDGTLTIECVSGAATDPGLQTEKPQTAPAEPAKPDAGKPSTSSSKE